MSMCDYFERPTGRHQLPRKDCNFLMFDIERKFEFMERRHFTCYDFSVLDSDRHVAC